MDSQFNSTFNNIHTAILISISNPHCLEILTVERIIVAMLKWFNIPETSYWKLVIWFSRFFISTFGLKNSLAKNER